MSKKSIKKENVIGKIENEGLSYWLTDFFDPNDIEEKDVRAACIKARKVLIEVEGILEDNGYFI